MISNLINYSFLSTDFIKDLVLRCVPDAQVNDISPFQCSSPNSVNPFNSSDNSKKDNLYFGIFNGDSNLRLIVPNNAEVVEIGIGNNLAPILFYNVDQLNALGSWVFVGYQISLSTGVQSQASNVPSFTQPFNGLVSPVIPFLSNNANNSNGVPSLALKSVFANGTDRQNVSNAATGLDVNSDTPTVSPTIAALSGVLSIKAKRISDNASGEVVNFNINGDIIPATLNITFRPIGAPSTRRVFSFLVNSPMSFNSLMVYKSDGTLLSGELADNTHLFNAGDTANFTFNFGSTGDMIDCYLMVQPIDRGFTCPFYFKILTGL